MVLAACAVVAAGGFILGWTLRGEDEGATVTVTRTETGASALPPAVERTRAAIVNAARTRSFDALRRLVPPRGFTYSYGGAFPGGAVAYWQNLERTTRERPFDTLARILQLPYVLRQGVYVWPFAYGLQKSELTVYERQLLGALVDGYAGDDYYGWRAGIRPDGTWIFFVAGD